MFEHRPVQIAEDLSVVPETGGDNGDVGHWLMPFISVLFHQPGRAAG
jgi:hypothetical protein